MYNLEDNEIAEDCKLLKVASIAARACLMPSPSREPEQSTSNLTARASRTGLALTATVKLASATQSSPSQASRDWAPAVVPSMSRTRSRSNTKLPESRSVSTPCSSCLLSVCVGHSTLAAANSPRTCSVSVQG